jgi:hypothetical protein
MEYRKLTETETSEPKSCHKVKKDRGMSDRIKAVLMYDDGYSIAGDSKSAYYNILNTLFTPTMCA